MVKPKRRTKAMGSMDFMPLNISSMTWVTVKILWATHMDMITSRAVNTAQIRA